MMRRVIVNGQSYAVGLDWFPLKEDMKRAELVLEAEGYDESAIYPSYLKNSTPWLVQGTGRGRESALWPQRLS